MENQIKKEMLKRGIFIVFIIIILITLINFHYYSYAKENNIIKNESIGNSIKTENKVNELNNTNSSKIEEQQNKEKNTYTIEENSNKLVITMEYIYNKSDNTITGKMHSNNPLKDTKISWTLSEDKLTYTTILRSNGSYTTTVEDIYGNVAEVLIDVKGIDETGPEITMEYKYNPEDNTVTAIMHSNEELGDTKPTWTLGSDKLTYSKKFDADTRYTTPVEDIYGNETQVLVEVTQINAAPIVTMEYIYNENDNTVTGIMHSNKKLKNTKVSWTLSEDQMTYTTILRSNGSYTTTVEDLWGHVVEVFINVTSVDDKGPEITMEYIFNEEDNTVTGVMHSNEKLKDTKVSWTLSEDQMTYTTILRSNGSYTTTVEDIWGNITEVLIDVKLVDETPPKITMEYVYNEKDNTVTGIVHSNEKLKDTKVSWTLSEDKLTYTTILRSNGSYTTTVEDIYGNKTEVLIEVTGIDETGPEITMEYIYDNKTNTVTGIMHSNEKLKDTKISWTLSEDKLTYTTILEANGSYTTTVEDIWGNKTEVLIEVTEIDEDPPEITVEYQYNDNNTVTAIMHSNEILGDTKPTWTLSEDKLSYTKTFDTNMNYETPVEDIYGNEVWVKIVINIFTDLEDFTGIDETKYPGYKEALQKLKSQYPNWNIKILYTGLDWNIVIEQEDQIVNGSPKSLIHEYYGNQNSEWINGTDKYDVSKEYYRASRKAIGYMMDPRNSLDAAWIFQFQDLSSSSGTREEIAKMVSGTFLNTDSIIDTIISTAQEQGISPFHIVSRIIQEQGSDGSGIMNGYEYLGKKVYNLFNINVSGDISTGALAGARYAYDKGWFTPEECIRGGAEFLKENYIDVGQTTLYFQKYNVVYSPLYTHQYMTNIRAANDEGNIMYNSYVDSGIVNSSFTFIIPVYENMPTNACPRPGN